MHFPHLGRPEPETKQPGKGDDVKPENDASHQTLPHAAYQLQKSQLSQQRESEISPAEIHPHIPKLNRIRQGMSSSL